MASCATVSSRNRGGAVDGHRCDEKRDTLRSVEGPSNGIATEHGVLWEFQRALQTRRVQVVLLCFTAPEFHESQASSEESWGSLRTAADFRRIYPCGDRVHPTLCSLEVVFKQIA